ncbi:MAG: 3-dehydroquinate synthase [Saprospiraceae bacterium]|jgi:3-dehydroquinate synthase
MVALDLQDYSIFVGSCQEPLNRFLKEHTFSKIFVLVDEHTALHCLPVLADVLAGATRIQIPAGEIHKNLDTCSRIWTTLMDAGAGRDALLVNVGGGVMGDMGGFCAATYKRGIAFVQIPTTLLSQVDASIGGKLGIDFHQVKNSVGVFANPRAVFVDPLFLNTLPPAELRSGFAEIIKHALIAHAGQWEGLKDKNDLFTAPSEETIVASLAIKQAIVAQDPTEKGLRKALNFGHTIGHAVESVSLDGPNPLLHGEAVAVGMICESFLSYKKGLLARADLDEICARLLHWYQPAQLDPGHFNTYFSLMRNDKKNEQGTINFSLIGPPGTVHINQYFPEEDITAALLFLNEILGLRDGWPVGPPFQKPNSPSQL